MHIKYSEQVHTDNKDLFSMQGENGSVSVLWTGENNAIVKTFLEITECWVPKRTPFESPSWRYQAYLLQP